MLKIAVCLSGQPRSIEYSSKSILNFFSSNDRITYDFFCHSWDYNTWKNSDTTHTPYQCVNKDQLTSWLQVFSPKLYIINTLTDLSNTMYGTQGYNSLMYSTMVSNHMKRLYEYNNEFTYDAVIKCRYDSVFDPNTLFDDQYYAGITPRTLFVSHLGRIPHEYYRLNPSDCVYYGDSWTMDIVTDLCRHMHTVRSDYFKIDDYNAPGPGSSMYEYATKYNIDVKLSKIGFHDIIYRQSALGLDAITDYDKIITHHAKVYQ